MLLLAALLIACHSTPKDSATEGDAPVSNLTVTVHEEVATILRVSWTQDQDAEAGWLEFWVEGEEIQLSPETPRPVGPQSEVVLGVPADTGVTLRLVERVDGEEKATATLVQRTGPLPEGLPIPTLESWDPTLTHAAPWMLGSVDAGDLWYSGPYWVWILDRQGRIVWYREVPDHRCTMFPRVSRDGTHIAWEESTWFTFETTTLPSLERTTLDGTWQSPLEVPDLVYAWDELDDGSYLYDYIEGYEDNGISHLYPDGTTARLWSCSEWLGETAEMWACDTNTVNWSPARDTVLWSMYAVGTVVELDRQTGQVRHAWGRHGTEAVLPAEAAFDMQHYPNWTDDGTLLVSTHVLETDDVQQAREFTLDESTGTLSQVWNYQGEDAYAIYAGEAARLDNGNTLVNYGTRGLIREITSDGQIAWSALFPGLQLVGHDTLVTDLYALNRGL